MSSSKPAEEEQLPLDIPFSKCLEWLGDRKKVSLTKYRGDLAVVRDLVNVALQDMPEIKAVTDMLKDGAYLSYFHARRILELMKADASEGASSFWRGYSSQRTRDWIAIVQAYERDNTWVGEACWALNQAVAFEIPALRMGLARVAANAAEAERKQGEYLRLAGEQEARFKAQCAELGIAGVEVRSELLRAADSELPVLFRGMAELACAPAVREALAYYREFLVHLLGAGRKDKAAAEETARGSLPALSYLHTHGNNAVGAIRRRFMGHPDPTAVEDPRPVPAQPAAASAAKKKPNDDDDGIDFGDDDDDGGIDFGDDPAPATGADAGGIDFGDDIDFGDGDAGDAVVPSPSGFVQVSSEVTGSFTVPAEALAYETLAESQPVRALLVNDLGELRSFLRQRQAERAKKGGDELAWYSEKEAKLIKPALAAVEAALAPTTTAKARHLVLVRISPKYLERCAHGLEDRLHQAKRFRASAAKMVEKQRQAEAEAQAEAPKVNALILQTKQLKADFEKALEEKIFPGRKCRLVGEINTL